MPMMRYYFNQEGRGKLIVVKATSLNSAKMQLARTWLGDSTLSLEEAENFLHDSGVEGPLDTEVIG